MLSWSWLHASSALSFIHQDQFLNCIRDLIKYMYMYDVRIC